MNSDLLQFYQSECDEGARLRSQAGQVEFRTTMHHLRRWCPPGARVLDCCAGTGVYSFALAEEGYRVCAGDLVPKNVCQIAARQRETPLLESVFQADMTDLSRFEDGSFDAVLCLGAYYHLCCEEERLAAVREGLRVLRPGGRFFLAYLNRYANFVQYAPEMPADFALFERYLETGVTNGLFYAATPEMVEGEMSALGLEILQNVAADGPLFYLRDAIDRMSPAVFERYLAAHLRQCGVRSNLGVSEHGLLCCKKK